MAYADVLAAATDGFTGPLDGPRVRNYYTEQWSERAPRLPEFVWQVDARIRSYGVFEVERC
jgi:hypothetical protein